MSTALIGKYFLCVHDECWRSGIVEAAVNDDHYIVRFDDLVRFNEDVAWPGSLAVAAINDMVENGSNDAPPPWLFFLFAATIKRLTIRHRESCAEEQTDDEVRV